MVVLQRTELGRTRAVYFLTIVLALAAIVFAASRYSESSETERAILLVFATIGLVALGLCLIQLYAFPRRSHVLLVHRRDDMIVATNALHEGFKLRFLRDVLSENVATFSDEDRVHWKFLEADGYYPAFYIRNPRKLLVVRLCAMIFDDVFAVDMSNRWEHHDSASTAEPAYPKGEMPPLKSPWMGTGQ